MAAGVLLAALSPADLWGQHLRIGVIGDQTGATDLDKAYQVLTEGVETLKKKNVDIVLHVGDLIESTRPESAVRNDFRRVVNAISALQKPWYVTAGDHDVNPGDWIPNSTDRAKETLFKELLGDTLPEARTRLYHSFNHAGYHFVALYSQEHLHTDPRWGNTFLARISAEQQAWLKDDLERNKDTSGTVVFLHQPLWYNWAGWLPVHQLLRDHGVLAVVAGHLHYDQNDDVIDGVHYLVIGATGADVKDANASAGGMHQVGVLDLLNRKADFALLDATSGVESEVTSRADAERVQAIDYAMDGFTGFADYNRFYLKDDAVVDDCKSAEPARMSLFRIGNPIDLPVMIDIRYDETKFELTAPHFVRGLCEDGDVGTHCSIRPGVGIAVSNSSGVSSCFASCPTPVDEAPISTPPPTETPMTPVWSSQIRPVTGQALKEDDRLQIHVSMHFQGEVGGMLVRRTLKSHPLVRCAERQP